MNGFARNTLREGGYGNLESYGSRSTAHSEAKLKKSQLDPFCHNESRVFARSGEKWIPATICSGIRYLREKINPPERYLYIRRLKEKTTEID